MDAIRIRSAGPLRGSVQVSGAKNAALPILCAMALSPYLGALCLQLGGVKATIAFVSGLALINIALVGVLFTLARGKPAEGGP